jgi:DNA repair photolyase
LDTPDIKEILTPDELRDRLRNEQGDLNVITGIPIKKNRFRYEGKTGIAETKEFKKKGLADFACNIGNVCEIGCTFCYVPTVTTKQKYVQEILKKGHNIDGFSLYRTKENLLNCVKRDLNKIEPGDNRVVFFCTTCDPCATDEHADITTSGIRLIMESSDLQVRVLSKNILIFEIAKNLDRYRDRIMYSLSTGTCRPEISACIEGNASPVEERIDTLKTLQDGGYRTYGTMCPILPSEIDSLEELVDEIRPDLCEGVWAEAINVRGKSLVKTNDKLRQCGLDKDADFLEEVTGTGNKENWRNYCKKLFLLVQSAMEKRSALDKLKFLQYVKREPSEFEDFFETQEGAVCL